MFDFGERKDREHTQPPIEDLLFHSRLREERAEQLRMALHEEIREDKPTVRDVAVLASKLEAYFDECVPVPTAVPAPSWEEQQVINVRVNDLLCRVGPRAFGLVEGDDWQLFLEDWMSGEPGLIPTEVKLWAEVKGDPGSPVEGEDGSPLLPFDVEEATQMAARILTDKIVETIVPQILDRQPPAAAFCPASDN